MNLFGLFKRRETPAATARERLHFVLSHERAGRDAPDFMPRLQEDILAAIRRYVPVGDDRVSVRMARLNGTSRLEVNVDIPPEAAAPPRRRR